MKHIKNNASLHPGLKCFFSPRPLDSHEISISGLGVGEMMQPGIIERPRGTGDYLFMLFHDPAFASGNPASAKTQPADTMMIWPPGAGQYYGNPDHGFSHSWIHCAGTRIQRMLRSSGLPILEPFAVSDGSRFQRCLLDVHNELVSYISPDPAIVANLIENSLRELARLRIGTANEARIPENLLAVRRLISAVPTRQITLDEMAAMAGMSGAYFCSVFKKIFGLSPMACLIQHRMHYAAHLLTNRNLNISQIAVESGYDDLFHFSKTFKKHFGLSPREMRKRGGAPE